MVFNKCGSDLSTRQGSDVGKRCRGEGAERTSSLLTYSQEQEKEDKRQSKEKDVVPNSGF